MAADAHSFGELIVVSGMHRSGTSALTRVLNLLGGHLPEPLVPPFEGNELGHWEPEAVVHMNDRFLTTAGSYVNAGLPVRPSWFASRDADRAVGEIARYLEPLLRTHPRVVVKDPRIALLTPLWRRAAERIGATPRFVLAFRHPAEVAASLARRQLRFFPDEVWTPERGLLIWLNHVVSLERATRGAARSFVAYDALLADWRSETERLASQLGVAMPATPEAAARIDAELRPDAKRERAPEGLTLPRDVRQVVDQLQACIADPDGGAGAFDAATSSLGSAAGLLGDYLNALETKVGGVGELRRRADGAERARDDAQALADAGRRAAAVRILDADANAELRRALLDRDGEGGAVSALRAAHAAADQTARIAQLERQNAALLAAHRDRTHDARAARARTARMRDEDARRALAHEAEASAANAAAEDLRFKLEAAETHNEDIVAGHAEALRAAEASFTTALDQVETRAAAALEQWEASEAASRNAAEATKDEERVLAEQAFAAERRDLQAQARDHAEAAALARLRASTAEAALAREVGVLSQSLAQARTAEAATSTHVQNLSAELDAERQARRAVQADARAREGELLRLRRSKAWRVTAPLRRLRMLMAR